MIVAAGFTPIFRLIAATGLSGVVDSVAAISAVSWLALLLRIEHIRLMGILQTDDHGSLQRATFSFLRFLLLLGILQIGNDIVERPLPSSPIINDNAFCPKTRLADRVQQASRNCCCRELICFVPVVSGLLSLKRLLVLLGAAMEEY